MIDIQILKTDTPGRYWAKEAPGPYMTQEALEFQRLSEDINRHFNDDNLVNRPLLNPKQGQICIGMRSSDKKWYRVKVQSVLLGVHGHRAVCFLMDYAETENISPRNLREAPEYCLKVPFQAKLFVLYDIQPLTMVTDPDDMTTSLQPSQTWDPSALAFVKKLHDKATHRQAETVETLNNKDVCVRMYMTVHAERICLNDLLVEKQYAIFKKDVKPQATPAMPETPHMSANPQEFTQRVSPREPSKRKPEKGHRSPQEANCDKPNFKPAGKSNLGPKRVMIPSPEHPPELSSRIQSDVQAQPVAVKPGIGRAGQVLATYNKDKDKKPGQVNASKEKNRFSSDENKWSPPKSREEEMVSQKHGMAAQNTCGSGTDHSPKGTTVGRGRATHLMLNSPPGKSHGASNKVVVSSGSDSGQRTVKPGVGMLNSPRISIGASDTVVQSSGSDSNQRTIKPGVGRGGLSVTVQHPVVSGRHKEAKHTKLSGSDSGQKTVSLGRGSGIAVTVQSPGYEDEFKAKKPSASNGDSGQKTVGLGRGSGIAVTVQTPVVSGRDKKTKNKILSVNDGDSDQKTVRLGRGSGATVTVENPPVLVYEKEASGLGSDSGQRTINPGRGRAAGVSVQSPPVSAGRGKTKALYDQLSSKNKGTVNNKEAIDGTTENRNSFINSGQFDDSHDDVTRTPNKIPERPRTPNNVHFSETDELLKPRPGMTPPSCEAKPFKSILKKSPSVDSDTAETGSLAKPPIPSWKFEQNSGSESDNRMESYQPFKATGRLSGTKLLETLKGGNISSSYEGPLHQEVKIDPTSEKVIYQGPTEPQPLQALNDLPYSDLIDNFLDKKEIAQLNKLARYCLFPIQRGLHVAGVAAKSQWNMLTYIFPMFYQLQQKSYYKDLPKGFGPMVLVISSSWRKARLIHDCCSTLTERLKSMFNYPIRPRVKVIFGGDADESKEISLMNGCEILVATPDCLLRMLDKEATSLNRVCHLVFDDADILTKEFTKQVQNIMQRYLQVQKEAERSAPKQVLAFGNTWNASFSSFSRYFLTSPTIVITIPTEAAIFGNIRVNSNVCYESQRVEHLLSLFDSATRVQGKTIVFTTDKVQAESLYEILRAQSVFCLVAHENFDNIRLEEVQREWLRSNNKKSPPVLVLTDQALDYMSEITDAQVVIHFDPPPVEDKWCMGRRLWCMRKYFVNRVENKEAESQCQTFLFLTSQIGPEAQQLVKFLERTYNKVPDLLRKSAERFMNRVEKGKSNSLCEFMKAFGKCRDEKNCRSRHVVFRTLDTPGISPMHQKLPRQGKIKVLITHVKNGSCYYGRMLEHTVDGKTIALNSQYFKLVTKMNMHFGVPERRQKCNIPERSKLYAYEDAQHTFHRVETDWLSPIGTHGISEEARVNFIDMGKMEKVHTNELYELPEALAKIPFQAVELIVCRVKPVDNDIEWTGPATTFMSDLIFNKTLDGTILLSMGNTLWLDTLVEREHLQEVKVINTLYNVKSQLLLNNFGVENNQHLHLLYSACQGRLDLPEGLYNPEHSAIRAYTVYGKPLELIVESLPLPDFTEDEDGETWADDAFIQVYVSAISTPDLIYLQLGKRQKQWLDLQEDINTYIKLSEAQYIEDLKKGTLVLAKFPLEETESLSWYRGKIMDIKEGGQEVDVFFVDTGEQEWVSRSNIQPLITRFLHLPFQAIECSLVHLEAVGDDWSEAVSDFIWDYTRTEGDDPLPKPVYAKVVNHAVARHSGKYMYGVELYDTSKEYNVNIGAHIVAKGMAGVSTEYLEELFPLMADTVTQSYSKIPVICRAIMSVTEEQVRVKLSVEVLQVLQENMAHQALEMGQNGIISCLCSLLQCVWDKWIVDTMCTLLVQLAMACSSNLEQVTQRLDVFCEILEHCSNSVVYEAILAAMCAFAQFTRCRHVLLGKGVVRIISKVLNSSQSLPVRKACLDNLIILVTDLPQGYLRVSDDNSISKSGCIPSVCKCLSLLYETDDFGKDILLDSSDIALKCVEVFEELAKHPILRDTLRKQGAVKEVCAVLSDPDTMPELLDLCVRTLDLLASNNRFNKDKMSELGMPQVFSRLAQSPHLKAETKSLCNSLQGRLEATKRSQVKSDVMVNGGIQNILNKMPKPIKIQGMMLTSPHIPTRSATPETMWAQSKWNILLSIQAPGVFQKDRVANFTPESVKFYAVANATEYTLELDLYELIVKEKCQVQVCASQVRLGLRKKVKGRWPRLTKLKNKLPYLKVDYDRFLDSSESEEEEEESTDSKTEDIEEPLALAQRNNQRYVPFSKLCEGQPSKPVNFNPEILEGNSSGQSDSSEIDDIMSKPYRDEHDSEYFHL